MSSLVALDSIFRDRVAHDLQLKLQLGGWLASSRDPPLSSPELEGQLYVAASGWLFYYFIFYGGWGLGAPTEAIVLAWRGLY